MSRFEELKNWYRWGHWGNTTQGVCVLLSLPICWVAAITSSLWSAETKPLYLSSEPAFFFITPLLAFLYFVRFGMYQEKQFSSSLFTTIVVLAVIGMPFYVPYFRSHGT